MVKDKVDFSTLFSKGTSTTVTNQQSYEIITSYNNNQNKNQNNNPNQLTTTGNFSDEQINLLSTLPFWITDKDYHEYKYLTSKPIEGSCCFNHYVGLPFKHGKRGPLWDYEIADQF